MVLTEEQKRSFIRDGYVVLRNMVPPELVQAALRSVDASWAEGKYDYDTETPEAVPGFKDEAQAAPEIGRIITDTKIIDACNDLLGQGNSNCGKRAQIAFRPTDRWRKAQGMSMTKNMPKHKWHIDAGKGIYEKTATPFTLLVAVALSPGQHFDENRGQLNVWPGSHLKLHAMICERVKKNLITDGGYNMFGYGPGKPDMGEPIRVLLRPGDVCLAHQRLGHSGGINLHRDTRKQLYFRVSHKNHDDFLDQILEGGSVFTEYEGIKDVVGDL